MTTRTVVTRTQRDAPRSVKNFTFTREMVPGLAGSGSGPVFLQEYRQRAWETFESLPIPTTSEEAWRRTDLRSMPAGSFQPVSMIEPGSLRLPPPPAELLQSLTDDAYGGQIVLAPEGIQVDLNPALSARGVVFTDLATAESQYPHLLEKILGQVVRPEEGKFAALAGAMTRAGVLLYVPRGVELEQPLHSILWAPGANLAYFSHILVYLEDGASATYVHEAASPDETAGQSLHSGLIEIHVGESANLRFVELQSWGDQVWNFSHERARVARDGNLDWIFGAIGSRLTKNFSDLELVGQGASGRMSGFYFTDGTQHLDHDTQQNHLAPNTTSDLLFKGALRDHSRSVWQGMIYVAPGAQKTDGYQANRNLVLSPNARADSIPGLEIMADDVRCTHGATVGKIDQEMMFYLRSRGIPQPEAERLIVEGYFDPIMQRIPFEGVRTRFQAAIIEKMG
ncbi:MAG: Fe-S cluster assembly protein SufD [Anaerolineales bacterium]|nr:Fe-S cluster assembly protein SufD [Anaerolineales bacterium]